MFALPSLATLPVAEAPAPTAQTATAAAADVDVDVDVDVTRLTSIVQKQVLVPLRDRAHTRSKMSRAALPPQKRRVRIIDAALRTDDKGRQFVTFAIDAMYRVFDTLEDVASDSAHESWSRDEMTGCVYANGEVFVRTGDVHRSAAAVVAKKKSKSKSTSAEAPLHICHDRTAQVVTIR